MKSIYIYGASGHGLVIADIARRCGYENIIFVDDGNNEFPDFESIKNNIQIPISFGIGSNKARAKTFQNARNAGFKIVNLIDPSAIISNSAIIGDGVVVMPNVVVNAKASIGDGVILNSGSVVEHECVIGDFVHISPKVALAGNVSIGNMTHIGIGSSVIQGLSIGQNCIVGAGSVVVKNIVDFKKAYGNPCRDIEDIK
ncbi:MAG: NeuD/PglB/VioB family sugar acetyltransferase [Epsilonproteobacteria bacterium]|nr:NeuD/PglB/VioB family sugar acetyltransferase [Campylobacterota bacterium]